MYRINFCDDQNEYLSLTLNSLYRNYLNNIDYETLEKDSWAFGFEACVYKHVMFFLGGNTELFETQYSEERNIGLSFGLGGNITAGHFNISLLTGVVPSMPGFVSDKFTIGVNTKYIL